MGAMPITRLRPAVEVDLAPGDWLAVLSDGIFEYEDPDGQALGAAAVEQLLAQTPDDTAEGMSARVLRLLRDFARGAPQEDDITMVLVKRLATVTAL
jgi:serine phosphatase RsbU (regulator of sigma subunit)